MNKGPKIFLGDNGEKQGRGNLQSKGNPLASSAKKVLECAGRLRKKAGSENIGACPPAGQREQAWKRS